MTITAANGKLLRFLGGTWLGFAFLGLLLLLFFPIPQQPLLIDRSYCPAEQWQQLGATYRQLYQDHQQKKIRMTPVIYMSSLGEETLVIPPAPEVILGLNTFGRPSPQRLQSLRQRYPQATVLQCS